MQHGFLHEGWRTGLLGTGKSVTCGHLPVPCKCLVRQKLFRSPSFRSWLFVILYHARRDINEADFCEVGDSRLGTVCLGWFGCGPPLSKGAEPENAFCVHGACRDMKHGTFLRWVSPMGVGNVSRDNYLRTEWLRTITAFQGSPATRSQPCDKKSIRLRSRNSPEAASISNPPLQNA